MGIRARVPQAVTGGLKKDIMITKPRTVCLLVQGSKIYMQPVPSDTLIVSSISQKKRHLTHSLLLTSEYSFFPLNQLACLAMFRGNLTSTIPDYSDNHLVSHQTPKRLQKGKEAC